MEPSDKVYWNADPIVATSKPTCCNARAKIVPIITAGKCPGTAKRNLCH